MQTHNNPTTIDHQDHEGAALKLPELHPRAGLNTEFATILQEALTRPGLMNEAYRAFHNFSLGNQILAAVQLYGRGLSLSPIASFNTWKENGRFVRKGQRAISLLMPVPVKRREKNDQADSAAEETIEGGSFSVFMLRANWFSLEQTEGADFVPEIVTPTWDPAVALAALGITEEPFDSVRGNVLGYARGKTIAINPLNPLKHKTRFHELAHVVLGHTTNTTLDEPVDTPRDIREAEAEGVAYILCSLLDLPGQAESRHYIQGWLDGSKLPEKSAKKIFGAADRIMKSGQATKH